MITTSTNFDAIWKAYQDGKKGIVLEGGSRTGKDWDACAFNYEYMKQKRGKAVNAVRDYRAILVKTLYQTYKKVYNTVPPLLSQFNKTATPINWNNNTLSFIGVSDNIMTAHGLESDLLHVSEGWSIEQETLNQLLQRTNDFAIINLNPSGEQHYLYDFEYREDFAYHKTNIFDNPYAPKAAKEQILSYAHPDVDDYDIVSKYGYEKEFWEQLKEKNYKLNSADAYLWQVYGLGLRAAGTDMVFNANRIHTYKEEPESYDFFHYGGDFGYVNDPATYTAFKVSGNNLYVKNYIYETGLDNIELADKIKALGVNDELSIWDSAEQKSIAELKREDITAASVKFKDIAFGIRRLQRMNIFIHEDSVNALREFKGYKWKKDKQGQYVLNSLQQRVPVDKDNHIIDPARYVVTRYLDY